MEFYRKIKVLENILKGKAEYFRVRPDIRYDALIILREDNVKTVNVLTEEFLL